MSFKSLHILFFAFIILSCNYNPYSVDNERDIIVKYNKNSLVNFQTKGVISKSVIIPIKNDSINLGSELIYLSCNNANIIADKISDKIYIYDSNFEFLRLIYNVGEANNQYPSITSVNLDRDNNLHIFSNRNYTETVYDLEGRFIEQNSLSYIFSSAYSDSTDYFYYLTNLNAYFNDRVLITDNNGAVIGKYFPEDYKTPLVPEEFPVFVKSPASDAVYVRKTMTSNIYKFLNDTMFCAYTFDFGEYAIPERLLNTDDTFSEIQKPVSSNYATLVKFFKGSSIAILVAVVQKTTGPWIAYAINNKGTWIWLNYPFPNNLSDPLSGSLQGISANDELVFIVSTSQVEKLFEDKSFIISNKDKIDKDLLLKNGFFFLKAELKK